jgi:hypothetical protein
MGVCSNSDQCLGSVPTGNFMNVLLLMEHAVLKRYSYHHRQNIPMFQHRFHSI